jgi:hypothetical protein
MVNNQGIQELKDVVMSNTKVIARLEGQLSHLVTEFNIVEEEELQSQEMTRGQYMTDEDCSNNSYHEHVQATTFGSEKVFKETVNESSLEDPLKESFAEFEFNLDFDMIRGQAQALLDPTPGM